MNTPPTDGRRVPVEVLRGFVADIFAAVPVPADDAQLIADLLIETELRGVASHGVLQVERYVENYKEGMTNTHPEIKILREGPTTAALSGEGGLGIVVGTQAMRMAIDKAKQTGVGAVSLVYHEHIGSAGKYARMAMREDMVGMCFSGRSAAPEYGQGPVRGSIQGSPPFCIGMPSGEGQPDLMVDFATGMPWDEESFAKMPEIYYRGLGLAHAANIMSGTLGGQMLPEFDRQQTKFQGANQSSFYMALAIESFVSVEDFKADMDHLMQGVSAMEPYPGAETAQLPGGLEWHREREYTRDGIPISREAVEGLERMAQRVGGVVPW